MNFSFYRSWGVPTKRFRLSYKIIYLYLYLITWRARDISHATNQRHPKYLAKLNKHSWHLYYKELTTWNNLYLFIIYLFPKKDNIGIYNLNYKFKVKNKKEMIKWFWRSWGRLKTSREIKELDKKKKMNT